MKLLDQGEGSTCVIYALALALYRHLLLSSGVQIIVRECLGAIKQLDKAREAAREGNFVEDFQGEVLRNIGDECGGVVVSFPRQGDTSEKVILKQKVTLL